MLISHNDFKELMSLQCSSVTIISTVDEYGGFSGFTATSLQALSVTPPVISFCLSLGGRSAPVFQKTHFVGVSLLSKEARDIAERFSSSTDERFVESDYFIGVHGIPLIRKAVFNMVGRIVDSILISNSRVFISEVLTGSATGVQKPLLYHRRQYLVDYST
jgi:flavin reductase (DIM6/NTAB) family NADH-FMN oxidoreductase RutF